MSKITPLRSSSSRSIPDPPLVFLDMLRWLPVAAWIGLTAGTASALLLASLTFATTLRERHIWLILFLAPAGWCVGLLYKHLGKRVEGGNNLILEQVHDPKDVIPLRMAPLVLVSTFASHVFGGSAGREGTAIQMGASLADQLTRPLRIGAADRRLVLMAGISAGFASVFGTPVAGAVFGIEVLAIGALSYDALFPCLLSAFLGDMTTRYWAKYLPGVHHTLYRVSQVPAINLSNLTRAAVAGIAFGLTAMLFARLTHSVAHAARAWIGKPELRPVVGGLLMTTAVFGIGYTHTAPYLGLGLPTIEAAFTSHLPGYGFLVKILFTAVTLGTGFKGGEVTPLFFIGATLGNALSLVLHLPVSLLAGMGFVAVFAGAANTPLASTFMAYELFGTEAAAYAGVACVLSYLCSGQAGIYGSQRMGTSKLNPAAAKIPLALIAKLRRNTSPEEKPSAPTAE